MYLEAMRSLLSMFAAVVLIVAESSSAQGPGRGDSEQWSRFEGVWRPKAGSANVIDDAIQKTVRSMNVVARPIARRKLAQKNVLPLRLRMDRQGEFFMIHYSAAEEFRLPLSGAAVKYGDRTMRLQLTADGLRHTGETAEGRRQNLFRGSGDVMTMSVTMSSPRLPRPLQYTLEFTRVK
jgi:hypothetical protein